MMVGGAAMGLLHVATERREWKIPPEAKTMKNPVTNSSAALEAIRPVYREIAHSVMEKAEGETGPRPGPTARFRRILWRRAEWKSKRTEFFSTKSVRASGPCRRFEAA